jgi:hypothetical protein
MPIRGDAMPFCRLQGSTSIPCIHPFRHHDFVFVDAHMEQQVSFDFGFAFIFSAALHGFSAMKIVIILYINHCIATQIPRK